MTGTPPGWYPDAQGVRRWFDGESWTEHTQDAAQQPTAAADAGGWPSPPPATGTAPTYGGYQSYAPYPGAPQQPSQAPVSGGGGGGRAAIIGGVLALVVVAVVLGIVLVANSGGDDRASDTSSTTTATTATTSTSSATDEPSTPETSDAPTTPETSDPPSPDPTDQPAPPGRNTPEAVTRGFMKAIFTGDCEAATRYVAPELAGAETGCADTAIPTTGFDGLDFEVGKATYSNGGDTATLPVSFVFDFGGGADPSTFPSFTVTVDRVDGVWRVTNFA